MNINRLALVFSFAAVSSLPIASAQYVGTFSVDNVAARDQSANKSAEIDAATKTSPSSIAAIPAPLMSPAKPVASPAALGAAPLQPLQSINPSSLKIIKPGTAPVKAGSVTITNPNSVKYTGMKPPAGAKKGHWVDAPMYSMMGMPSWVEEK